MVRALETLGIDIDARWDQRQLSVSGCANRLPSNAAQLNLAGSGTSIRFLSALVATGSGEFTLDGNEQMRKRPIGDLLHALNRLGARATSADGCPPVRIKADGLKGGSITLKGNLSSQFLSGLLLAAPAVRGEVEIEIVGPLVSKPYINMTIALMHAFGVKTEQVAENCFRVPHPQSYRPTEYQIEPDASAASYFWATAAITGREALRPLPLAALRLPVAKYSSRDCLAKASRGMSLFVTPCNKWAVRSMMARGELRYVEANSMALIST